MLWRALARERAREMRRYERELRETVESEVAVVEGECSRCGAPLLRVGERVRCAREVYRSVSLFFSLWRGDAGWVGRWPYEAWLARLLRVQAGENSTEEV
ncbi:MAG: hypothetical protein ACUVS5_11845 [Anaerolineae bacterium]